MQILNSFADAFISVESCLNYSTFSAFFLLMNKCIFEIEILICIACNVKYLQQ